MTIISPNPTKLSENVDQFTILFRPHIKALYRIAYRWTWNVQDAEDLVQDLALKVMDRVHEMAEIERLQPWLLKIMYRRFVDIYRRKKNSPVLAEYDLPEDGGSLVDRLIDSNGPDNQLYLNQLKTILRQRIDELDPDQKAAVMLYDAEGFSIKEIASITETKESTVKSRLHRARSHLKNNYSWEPFINPVRVTD